MTIETARMTLIPASVPFIEAVLLDDRALAGRVIGATLAPNWPPDVVRERALPIAAYRLREDPALEPWLGMLMVLRADKVVVGMLGFKGPPDERGAIEIGWGIESEYEGKGLTTEAARAMIDWAARQPGVQRVLAQIPPDNERSRRVAARLGMKALRTSLHPDVGTVDVWEVGVSSAARLGSYR